MKKVAIIYGCLENDLQKRAVEELSALLLDYIAEYPICVAYAQAEGLGEDYRRIYVGTRQNHPYLEAHSVHSLAVAESYTLCIKDDTVIIEGYDDAGALYGVLDFYHKYVIKFEHSEKGHTGANEDWVDLFGKDELPVFEYTSAPTARESGLWTWGHVIYDYRAYLHNMMKLKMNGVIIWNDFAPINAKEIVAYAHSCNIKVYWGFAWLWDVAALESFDIHHPEKESYRIFQKYEEQYADSGADGIYFQTFTERKVDNIGGVLVAEAAAKFVNHTSAMFYEKYPDLKIQFGLHATSVNNRLEFIRTVDPRIQIVWEDCGAFPFAYLPRETEGFAETKDFVGKIVNLRGEDDHFGVVTKGYVTLDWRKFRHLDGSQCIGVSSETMRRQRLNRRTRQWRYIQTGWIEHADKAQEMVTKMCEMKKGELSIFALVEDGLFEESIMYPVALYAEMLWSCNENLKSLMKTVALRSYVSFV